MGEGFLANRGSQLHGDAKVTVNGAGRHVVRDGTFRIAAESEKPTFTRQGGNPFLVRCCAKLLELRTTVKKMFGNGKS